VNDQTKLDYFIERTDEDLKYLRIKVDKLWEFRVFLLGGSAVVSVIAAALFEIVMTLLGHK
jgi:hypothetical protein